MELEVNGYRGVDRAKIAIPANEITMIAGENANGKSSLIEPLIFLAAAESKPFGLNKTDCGDLVHTGAKEAVITLRSQSGTRQISLPKQECRSLEGQALSADDIALGLRRFSAMSEDERAKLLSERLKAQPDRARLEQELSELFVDPKPVKEIVDTVFGTDVLVAQGFDSAQKWAAGTATQYKGEFRQVTGVNWGANQGANFVPADYTPEMDQLTVGQLEQIVVEARERMEEAIRANAVSEAEHQRLEALTADAEKARDEAQEWQNKADQYEAEYADAMMLNKPQVKCSGCGLIGHVSQGQLVETDIPLSTFGNKPEDAKAKFENAKIALMSAKGKLSQIAEAQTKLANWSDAPTGALTIDTARAQLANAEARLKAKKVKLQGATLHDNITGLLKAADLLAPTGLRRRVLTAALVEFHKTVAQCTEKGGWGTIVLDGSLTPRYNGRHYRALSKSEQYRVDATLQVALSRLVNAPIVVLDGADILDKGGRNGLLRLLKAWSKTAVVGMTILRRKDGSMDVPDLKELKLGVTYWVSGGKVSEYAAPQAVTA